MKARTLVLLTAMIVVALFAMSGLLGPSQRTPLDVAPSGYPSPASQIQGSTISDNPVSGEPKEDAPTATEADALCEPVPLLPNAPEFKVDSCDRDAEFSSLYATEFKDVSWAGNLEARILDELENLQLLRESLVTIECRTTACGILFVPADGVDRREQFWPERPERPQWESVEALPGFVGFEVQLPPLPPNVPNGWSYPPRMLAAESVDPTWSSVMEAQIIGEVSRLAAGNQYSQLHVECRTTICGVVIDYPPGVDPDIREIDRELDGVIDVDEHGDIDADGRFVTIYLQPSRAEP